jgi:hypothetical protein
VPLTSSAADEQRRAEHRRLNGPAGENRSTPHPASAMIYHMFRYVFPLAASAVADAPKAAVVILLAAVDGARS